MRQAMVPLCLLIFALPAAAQVVTGRVLEDGANIPVTGADVQLLRGESVAGQAVTDSAGRFLLNARAGAGTYTLVVRHLAYVEYRSATLELQAGQTVEVEIRLGRDVIPLEPMVVTASSRRDRLAGFRERSVENAFGRYITRDAIEKQPAARATDLLRTVPGVTVLAVKRGANFNNMTTYLITMRGAGTEGTPVGADMATAGYCGPAIFLDGVRIHQSADFPIDDVLRSTMLEGVEIYSRMSDAPAEYQAQSDCGVVLFWTRQGEGGGRRGWQRIALGLAGFGAILLMIL